MARIGQAGRLSPDLRTLPIEDKVMMTIGFAE